MVTSKDRCLSNNSLNLITNRAFIRSDEGESQYADASVLINKVSDLSVGITSKCKRFEVNKIITYIITVKNHGPSNSSGVILKDVLPPSVIFHSIVLSQGYFDLIEGCITCNLGDINCGEEVTATLKVIPKKDCPIISSVFVIGNEFDPNKENNVDLLVLHHKKHQDGDTDQILVLILVLYAIYKELYCNCCKERNLRYK